MENSVGKRLELGSEGKESKLGFGSAGGTSEVGSGGRNSELGFEARKLTEVDSEARTGSPFFWLLATSLTADLLTRLRGLIDAEKLEAGDWEERIVFVQSARGFRALRFRLWDSICSGPSHFKEGEEGIP